ncbi:MAG: hypothetical protein WBD86_00205 [Microgenomates group bacterium]
MPAKYKFCFFLIFLFPFFAGFLLIGGVGLIGFTGFSFIKGKQKTYNNAKDKKDGFKKLEIKGNDNEKGS